MGEISWDCCSGLIRMVSLPVCTCTWLLSVLFGFLLENGRGPGCVMRSGPLSPEMNKPSTLGFLVAWAMGNWHTARKHPEVCRVSGQVICYWLWNLATCLPGFHVCLAYHQLESLARVPFPVPLSQKRLSKISLLLLNNTLPHHHMYIWTHLNQQSLSYYTVAWQDWQ
jgi:hypothetical protein